MVPSEVQPHDVSSVHQDPEQPGGTSCSTPVMYSSHVHKSLFTAGHLGVVECKTSPVLLNMGYLYWPLIVFFTYGEERRLRGAE